jgi:hypothetical protein
MQHWQHDAVLVVELWGGLSLFFFAIHVWSVVAIAPQNAGAASLQSMACTACAAGL